MIKHEMEGRRREHTSLAWHWSVWGTQRRLDSGIVRQEDVIASQGYMRMPVAIKLESPPPYAVSSTSSPSS